MENIQKNHELILSKINDTHKASIFSKHKLPKLVAVSKKQDDYKIDIALACGQKIFGKTEYKRRLIDGKELILIGFRIKTIGPLQTNG